MGADLQNNDSPFRRHSQDDPEWIPQKDLRSPSRGIGLLGGTFNPIHNGHLYIAKAAQRHFDLDRVLFIPSADPPHKQGSNLPDAHHRAAMVRLAIDDDPGFALCDIELARPGRSYSVETVEALRQTFSDPLFFIIGMDAFREIATWRDPERLLTLCHFVVVSRAGFPFNEVASIPLFADLDHAPLKEMDAGTRVSYSAAVAPGMAIHFLSLPPMPVSASNIRDNLSTSRACLPAAVASYILRHGLYA